MRTAVVKKRMMREPKSLAAFEARAKAPLMAEPAKVMLRAKTMMRALREFQKEQDNVLVIFPATSQGGNLYFAQGLFKVLAPKVRVVSLLTTGKAEHEKSITAQIKTVLKGRKKVIVFDNKNMGHTENNVRSALMQTGVNRENVRYYDFEANPLGSKMSAYVQRNNKNTGRVEVLGINEANLMKLMYYKMKGQRENTKYSEWKVKGKVDIDAMEFVLDKMHLSGVLNGEVLSKAGLELYDKVGTFDPVFIDQKTGRIVSNEESLRRICMIVPKERIDSVVRRSEHAEAKMKRLEYIKGIAAAKDLIRERGSDIYS